MNSLDFQVENTDLHIVGAYIIEGIYINGERRCNEGRWLWYDKRGTWGQSGRELLYRMKETSKEGTTIFFFDI